MPAFNRLAAALLAACLLVMAGCGGGTSSPSDAQPQSPEPTFSLSVDQSRVWLVRGGEARLEVTIDPKDGFSQRVIVEATGLPEGVSAREAVVEPDASRPAEVIFEATDESKPTYEGPVTVEVAAEPASNTAETSRKVTETTLMVAGKPGTLDKSFGNEGMVISNGNVQTNDPGRNLDTYFALHHSNSIIVATNPRINNEWYGRLFRFGPDGTRNNSFGGTGSVELTDTVSAFEADDRGGFLVANTMGTISTGTATHIGRVKSNGEWDDSFGTEGKLVYSVGDDPVLIDMVAEPTGRFATLGTQGPRKRGEPNVNQSIYVAQWNSDQTLDEQFGHQGTATFHQDNCRRAGSLVRLPDHGYLVLGTRVDVGRHEKQRCVAKLTESGALDTDFREDGVLTTGNGYIRMAAAPAPDGKVFLATGTDLAGGKSGSKIQLLDSTGKPVEQFGQSETVTRVPVAPPFPDEQLGALKKGPDGYLYLAGSANKYGDYPEAKAAIARLSAETGEFDEQFGTPSWRISTPQDVDATALWVEFDSLGRILVGGEAKRDGKAVFFLLRIWP